MLKYLKIISILTNLGTKMITKFYEKLQRDKMREKSFMVV